ncbi:MAG: hypothetical protein E4H03_07895 [Myxococcales bacterium]|nr:MAG: hypothetical protein E4H03_07895 [Myxococcales bacterium]
MSSKYSTMKIAAVITLVVALLTAASHAAAHDPGLSSSVVTIDSSRIRVATSFNDKDLAFLTAPAPSLAVGIAGDRPALAGSGPTSLEAEPGHSAFGVDYRRQIDSDVRLELAIFDQLPHGHRHYVRVEDGSGNEIASRLLSADSSSFVVAGMGIARAVPTGIGSMVVLGVEHIVTGYDHLLFLLALLLPAGSAAVVVRLVTAFTVAHSLTLAASVLGFA